MKNINEKMKTYVMKSKKNKQSKEKQIQIVTTNLITVTATARASGMQTVSKRGTRAILPLAFAKSMDLTK